MEAKHCRALNSWNYIVIKWKFVVCSIEVFKLYLQIWKIVSWVSCFSPDKEKINFPYALDVFQSVKNCIYLPHFKVENSRQVSVAWQIVSLKNSLLRIKKLCRIYSSSYFLVQWFYTFKSRTGVGIYKQMLQANTSLIFKC